MLFCREYEWRMANQNHQLKPIFATPPATTHVIYHLKLIINNSVVGVIEVNT